MLEPYLSLHVTSMRVQAELKIKFYGSHFAADQKLVVEEWQGETAKYTGGARRDRSGEDTIEARASHRVKRAEEKSFRIFYSTSYQWIILCFMPLNELYYD